jgi:hypothetical protein
MQISIFEQANNKAKLFLLRRLATCKEIAPVMSQSLDRQLTIIEHICMRVHMMLCKWCRDYLIQIRLIRELANSAERSHGAYGAQFSEDAAFRLKQRLNHGSERER